ncbi:recombination-associated protein RdgC [Alloalcanivorax mobilis]|uniref:recombination-associated protein RdgC n=1 Tax=Alloalcanivorax mobilis TaxID=2019569 RepID=UPI000B5B17C9|nr:recombination-associated protein RdgC [Alloalcanivorax mobilis]ASK36136.1 recombinase [Alcanivorax sp. N3-2A]|tara:strand:+ start:5155 stop:6069 length:915 start_codon:yes stop_codon:yes gene_type:complete
MWIKNLTVFLSADPFAFTAAELEEKLDQAYCPPCGPQSLSSEGFVPPLKGEARMVIPAEGFLYFMYQEIVRLLPGPVIKEELDERVEALQDQEGRKIGRKERADLKDQITFELLPKAFTRSRRVPVLVDMERRRILVDCASESRAEQVVSALRKALGSLPVTRPSAPTATATAFNHWLQQPAGLPERFTLGDRCELKDGKGEGASVRFTAVDLSQEEILAHLESMVAVRLNLCFNDELELDLLQDFSIKRIKPLDLIQENIDAIDAEDAMAELMARITVQGGTLRGALDTLYSHFEVEAQAPAG